MADQAVARNQTLASCERWVNMATRPQNWEAIKALFDAALEEDSTQRSAFLKERCADASVCAEVERLLAEHDQAGTFLSTPALDDFPLPSVASSQRLFEGEVLAGRFRIVRFIAGGGMGEVYEAEDQELRERVAIKIIRPEILSQPNAVARFKREVHLARKVTHSNVCRIFDLFRHKSDGGDETVFISMELLHGKTLGEQLTAGCMDVGEVLPLVEQMASALGAAHAVGIVHRDFKPGNVVLVGMPGQWRAVVTDFGLALRSLTADEGASHSTGQTFFGTPAYMSPEQLEGRAATPASDIYALGLVMYEMVTGARPFQGHTPISAALKRLTETPVPPRRIRPGLSGVWESAILRCLERDPAKRFTSVAAVSTALTGQSAGLSIENSAAQQLTPHITSTGPVHDATRVPRQPKYRSLLKHLLLAACVIVLTGAVIIGYRSYLNPTRDPEKNEKRQQNAGTRKGPPAESPMTSQPVVRIAVLPFESNPNSPEYRRLSDTIADELASELGQAGREDLRVLAASIFGYKPVDRTPAQVSQELDVRYLVEGTIDCFNGKATCNRNMLELKVKVVDGSGQIQSAQTYLPQGDFSRMPAQIAEWIARTVQVKLLPETGNGSQVGGTANPSAYDFYLRGRYEFFHGSEPKAFSDFQEAIAIDPKYALAHEAIAKIHIFRSNNENNRTEFVAAKDEAKIALELDDRVAEAHSDLAWVLENNDFNWAGAEAEYRRALELNPSSTFVHKWYAMFLVGQGRKQEAIHEAAEALSLEPASFTLKAAYGWILSDAGQPDAGVDYLEKEMEIYPNYGVGWGYLGDGYNRKREYEKAASAFQHAADVQLHYYKLKTSHFVYRCGVAANLGLAGKRDEANKIATQIRAVWDDGTWIPAWNIAVMYFGMGNKDEGFKFLRRALQERSCTLHEINTEPMLRTLWDDPTFKDIRTEFHLPESPPA